MEYTKIELECLHNELLVILKEIIRVCDDLKIDYFIQGGTAIGAFYNKGIIPWDDDIDLGMTRDNYQRFIKEGPAKIRNGFFIQCFETDPCTPFYFVKVRKDNTLFLEKDYKDLDIHHGIFVDIFPFDKVPDSPIIEKFHRRLVNYCNGRFKRSILKTCIKEGLPSFLAPVSDKIVDIWFKMLNTIPRQFWYKRLCKVQALFNNLDCKYVSIVKMPLDQIAYKDICNYKLMPFADMMIKAPDNIETYLKHHYPHLKPIPPKEMQVTHAPLKLTFDTTRDDEESIHIS